MENRFNLVEEDWIPVAGQGRVSLRRIFTDKSLKSLGGTSIQKISVLKFLLAIAQAAYTPKDDDEWKKMGAEGMAQKCLDYLDEKRELFWLYGEKPFLQYPILATKKTVKGEPITRRIRFRRDIPDMPWANDTILFDLQSEIRFSDAEFAIFLISLMNYSLGGKRVANIGPLNPEYSGKTITGKSGPSQGSSVKGFLNTHLISDSVQMTIFLNVWTKDRITNSGFWTSPSTVPAWDPLPMHENDKIAMALINSLMGSLCALSRFVLLEDEGMIYCEGLQYPNHKEGRREPFFSWNTEEKFLWVNPEKKPWRNFISLLHTPMGKANDGFHCPQIDFFWNRSREVADTIGIWSGGLKVSANSGDHSVKQKDDYFESMFLVNSNQAGELWFTALTQSVDVFEGLSKILYSSMNAYQKTLKLQNPDLISKAIYQYWELAEPLFQKLIIICEDESKSSAIHKDLALIVLDLFNQFCPNRTARQMSAWAKHSPRLGKYLKQKIKEEDIAG
jgi:CRISPR system Cascade subunit CasA